MSGTMQFDNFSLLKKKKKNITLNSPEFFGRLKLCFNLAQSLCSFWECFKISSSI